MSAMNRSRSAPLTSNTQTELHLDWAILDRPLLSAIGLNLLIFAATLTLTNPRWATNDDAGMSLIAAGEVYGSAPDEHLLFINVVIGLVLKSLYGLWPQPPWYWLGMLGSMFASSVTLTYVFLRCNPRPLTILLAGAFIFAFPLHCVLMPQFTKTAFLTAHAGIILTASTLGDPHRLVSRIWGLFLLTVGALWRWDAFLMAACLAGPLVLYCALIAERKVVAWRQLVLWYAGGLALAYGLVVFNRSYYENNAEWKDFFAYNRVRNQFIDYGRIQYTPETASVFEKAGWDPIDLTMMQEWFFADRERYGLKSLQEISSQLPGVTPDEFQRKVPNIRRAEVTQSDALILIGTILVAFAFVAVRNFRWLVPAGTLCLAICCAIVFAYWLYLPFHALFPMFGAVLSSAVYASRPYSPPGYRFGKTLKRMTRVIVLVAAGVAVLVTQEHRMERSRVYAVAHAEMRRFLEGVRPRDNQLYVIWANSLNFEDLVHPWDDLTKLGSFKCLHLASSLQTPIAWIRQAEFGISDLCRALFERRDLFLISNPHQNGLLTEYAELHYGVRPQFKKVLDWRGKQAVTIYQLSVPETDLPKTR